MIDYGSFRAVDTDALRAAYEEAAALSPAQASAGSPLLAPAGSASLPRYFSLSDIEVSDMNSSGYEVDAASPEQVAAVVDGLNEQGWWPTPLTATSNPYIGPGPEEVQPGEFRLTRVGDKWDTSPYVTDFPEEGISTGVYIRNMGVLIRALGAE